ncbi:hypothetical protein FXO38_00067 [Capsicum annuum]|nr:hypothetical protein FXO37_16212 [Capsicum annuum]KAF3684845.1 hypothetical protein FXO38_00067 [Capsicum annuum]
MLNFEAKVWWTLDRYSLCRTNGDNELSPVYATLIEGVMSGYEFYITQFISREISDRAVGIDVILAFPCLLTQIFFEVGVPVLIKVYQYIESKNTTDLELTWYTANPMTRKEKQRAVMLDEILQNKDTSTTTTDGFTKVDDI